MGDAVASWRAGPAALVLTALALCAGAAHATEGGASVYLLGSGGPGAAVMPPIEGVFLLNTVYHYDGKIEASRQFTLGGNLVAGVKANINADFATVAWVPSTDVAGGATLLLGLALPAGIPAVDVNAVLSRPRGRTVSATRSDDAFIVGDPILTAGLGWTRGDLHVQVSTLLNVPIGDYRKDELSNLAFHRWALDASAAVTWRDDKAGWDVSAKTGLTFNGENGYTDYDTGTEWHVEAAVEKIFSPKFSAGVQAYHFDQISSDSGPGAVLGPFKGEVTGLGATGAYHFKIAGKIPATLRLHAMTEMGAKNRLEGNSVFLDFSMPLWVRLPPGH